ncbi:MAG TPA: fibronectin type III domain-containing protein [Terracidiphilus sp.]|jgi:hypothetical protein|nr:fibronectin type III domain-containing protein [Terracidiphilus sp.]
MASAAVLVGLGLSGCGLPGAPQPPSLNLPGRVTDLSAVRTGDQVTLAWTMPKKNTDKLLLQGVVTAQVCRRISDAGACGTAETLQFAPGADATFTETLPDALARGPARPIAYFVELNNSKGRSAGLSNGADVAAGAAPQAVTGLSAEVAKTGVLLRWTAQEPESPGVAIRLRRTLLTPPSAVEKKHERESPLAPPQEPMKRVLLVTAGLPQGRALDRDIRFGGTYAYRAQRVATVTADGRTLELDGPLSPAVQIDAVDIFPPDVPRDLVAVATGGGDGAGPAIDLSWMPDTEADLAGYIVYRRQGDGAWLRISEPQPVVGPGFHDGHVQPAQTYDYAVSAIDQEGHESGRSAEVQESVPQP